MRRGYSTALLVGSLALILTMAPVLAQQKGAAQKGQGRAGGMRGSIGFVEQSWAALCFEMDLSQTQYGKLKPSYQWAWKTRAAALKSAMEKRDFEGAAKTMASVKTTLEARVKSVLTKQQLAQWNKWQAEQAKRSTRGGPGGDKKK